MKELGEGAYAFAVLPQGHRTDDRVDGRVVIDAVVLGLGVQPIPKQSPDSENLLSYGLVMVTGRTRSRGTYV